MDELMYQIDKYLNGAKLTVHYSDGTVLYGYLDTIYETDNELDDDDPNYQEYYACTFMIEKVIKTGKKDYQKNASIEISKFNEPCLILDADDNVVWDENVKKAFVYQGIGNDIVAVDIAGIVNGDNDKEVEVFGSGLDCLTEMIIHKRKETNQSLED